MPRPDGKYLVMVVEDNPENSRLAEKILTKSGYACRLVETAIDALEILKEDRPDLILMDMSLPGLDGWQATARIKADPSTAAIPVIALTAFAMKDDRDRALAAGCDEYMAKPFRPSELLAVIKEKIGA